MAVRQVAIFGLVIVPEKKGKCLKRIILKREGGSMK